MKWPPKLSPRLGPKLGPKLGPDPRLGPETPGEITYTTPDEILGDHRLSYSDKLDLLSGLLERLEEADYDGSDGEDPATGFTPAAIRRAYDYLRKQS